MKLTPEKAMEIMNLITDVFDTYEITGMTAIGLLETMKFNIMRNAEEEQDDSEDFE